MTCKTPCLAPKKKHYPKITRQIKTAAGAVRRYVFGYIKGEPVKSMPELKAKRLEICQDCPEDQYDPGPGRCFQCGCVISIKAGIRDAHCDLNQW